MHWTLKIKLYFSDLRLTRFNFQFFVFKKTFLNLSIFLFKKILFFFIQIKNQPSKVNGACCYYLNDQQDCITSANISPDTSMISFTTENSSLFLYKLYDKNPQFSGDQDSYDECNNNNNQNSYQELVGGHSNVVFKSKFTHDSKYLLSCGADNVACLWDVNKPKATHVVSYSGHLYPVWDLEIFSRLNLFATASKDGTSRLWSFDNIYPLRIYCGHQSDVNCVRFHPNGAYLATGKVLRFWIERIKWSIRPGGRNLRDFGHLPGDGVSIFFNAFYFS